MTGVGVLDTPDVALALQVTEFDGDGVQLDAVAPDGTRYQVYLSAAALRAATRG